MFAVITWTINALMIGLVCWLVPARGPLSRSIRATATFSTFFAVAFIAGHTADIVLEPVFFLALLSVEFAAPRMRYRFSSDETTINALYFAAQGAAVGLVFFCADRYFGQPHPVDWGMAKLHWPLWTQGIVVALVCDLKQYFIHRTEHRSDFLWRFHKVHHSVTEMNIIAGWRTHILENALLQATTTYLCVWALGADLVAVMLFYFLPLTIVNFVAHMNVDFPKRNKRLPWYAYIVTTPITHALHHRVDTPKRGVNLGEIFTFWDVLFNSFVNPTKETTPDVFGIEDPDFPATGFFAQQAFSFRRKKEELV